MKEDECTSIEAAAVLASMLAPDEQTFSSTSIIKRRKKGELTVNVGRHEE
jgi:hypothetical protein